MSKQISSDDWIYHQVFGAILEQRLIPGAKLKESVLCDIFGVSRTIIRRILLRLSLDKVVELRPNRGAVIAEPQAEDVRQIFEARRLLENGIVGDAAAKSTPGDGASLREIVVRENDCIRSGDRSGAIRLSGEFHLELAAIAGNRPLEQILRQLVAQTSLAIALYEAPGHLLCVEDDHISIVAAVEAGDAALGRKLMREHLVQCEAQLSLNDDVDRNDLRAVFADVLREREIA
jgi:DNA-binding GntR family transcriptional regulator